MSLLRWCGVDIHKTACCSGTVRFDGVFPIYRNWDRVLSMHYGDWKQQPPLSQRPVHLSFCDPFRSASGFVYPAIKNK